MQQFYVKWQSKAELTHILQALQKCGYQNVRNLDSNYRFPVIVIDRVRKLFYESHASYMTAHLAKGTLKLYGWQKVSVLL